MQLVILSTSFESSDLLHNFDQESNLSIQTLPTYIHLSLLFFPVKQILHFLISQDAVEVDLPGELHGRDLVGFPQIHDLFAVLSGVVVAAPAVDAVLVAEQPSLQLLVDDVRALH